MLTGARKDQYDYLVTLRRQRLITKEVFESEKAKLYRKEQGLEKAAETREKKREAAEAKKEAEREKKRAEARAAAKVRAAEKAKAKRKMQGQKRLDTLFQEVYSGDGEKAIQRIYDAVKGRGNARVLVIAPNGDVRADKQLEPIYKATGYGVWRTQLLEGGYEGDPIFESGDRVLVMLPTKIKGRRIAQLFSDGLIDHCVFGPVIKNMEARIENSKSNSTIDALKKRVRAVRRLESKYVQGIEREIDGVKVICHGVPLSEMREVAEAAHMKITVNDWTGSEIQTFNEKKTMAMTFTNTRFNHVDPGKVVLNADAAVIDEETMMAMMKSEPWYMVQGSIVKGLPRKIVTINGAYELENPDKEAFQRMDEMIERNDYSFPAGRYPEMDAFLKEATVVCGTPVQLGEDQPTGHRDMPAAYTQFKKCSYYQGFLGVIHQWRSGPFDREFVEKHVGIYRARIIGEVPSLLRKLGLTGSVTLPGPELLFFMDCGVEMVVDAGCWGAKFDFEFPEEMLENKRYARWCGMLDSKKPFYTYSFKATEEWAAIMKDKYGENCHYYGDICTVRVPTKHYLTHRHIFAFITSYLRIQMLQAMMAFKEEQLCRVVMDGIYFTGEAPAEVDWFVEKTIKVYQPHTVNGWYRQAEATIDWKPIQYLENTLITGQGGAGKTYSVCTYGGYNDILFVAPEHLVGQDALDKYAQHGVQYTVTQKLIGDQCRPFKEDKWYPAVLFCDEITKWTSEWCEAVFKMYPKSLILMAGDMNASGQWYQLRNPTAIGIWKPTVPVKEMPGDRRSVAGDPLIDFKLKVRAKMDEVYAECNGDSFKAARRMKAWIRDSLPLVSMEDAVASFKKGDVWIAGKHDTSDLLLAYGVFSGWIRKGGSVSYDEEKPAGENWNKRGAFTAHSFQGKTIRDGKVFISTHDMFDYSMFYTAVSRAVRMDQLVFVAAPSV